MSVNKFILFFLLPLACVSQTTNYDAYFILNKSHSDYVVAYQGYKLNKENLNGISTIYLYDRKQYEKRQKYVERDKKKGTYNDSKFFQYKRPSESVFNVIEKEKDTIIHCDIHQLNIVNYDWIIRNTWKENNPNILFKNLFFLYKLEKGKFIKLKVARTVTAH
ncbi:hypothetical protein [Polaribacter cellanae]|uniref:Uncharacterized protein n=1 Tax=Polaribacter cellanae TaxID=2818493 RepID=A0A975CL48_9FLAO|nr:hypothetical protein [Polaribacter cellanae]QTE21319.1 hypothetical protein J3359_10810 [Polaribacter cellanae]